MDTFARDAGVEGSRKGSRTREWRGSKPIEKSYLVMILNGLADVALAPPAGKKSTDSIE